MILNNQRGFTLFTALVGFVLIALGFLLANTMIHSENNLQSVISSIDEQSEMQSLSDLLQSDAFQYFNWYFRVLVEQAITGDDIFMSLDVARAKDMPSVIDSFAKSKLNTEGFANKISDALTSEFLGTGRTFKNYRVCLHSCDETERKKWDNERRPKFNASLRKLLNAQFEQKVLLEPIDCPNAGGVCTNGSFYVNLDLTLRDSSGEYIISDEEMENFPQISVESAASGRIIRSPILPRSKLRFYVPNRLFKAIWSAREIAKKSVFEVSSTEFQDVGLGFCDSGCFPREDPYVPQNKSRIDNALCPGTVTFNETLLPNARIKELVLQNVVVNNCNGSPCVTPFSYDPNQVENMKTQLESIVRDSVNTIITPLEDGDNYGSDQDFILINTTSDVTVNPTGQSIASFVDDTKRIKISAEGTQYPTIEGSAYCVRPQFISATVSFEELDPRYFVLEESALRKEHIYRIQIVSGFLNTDNSARKTCESVITKRSSVIGTILPELSEASCFDSVSNPDGSHDCLCRP